MSYDKVYGMCEWGVGVWEQSWYEIFFSQRCLFGLFFFLTMVGKANPLENHHTSIE